MNISSAVVSPAPGCALAVQLALHRMANVELHAVSADGKFVISFESADDHAAADTFDAVQRVSGVLAAALVFTQSERDPNQEISDETDPT